MVPSFDCFIRTFCIQTLALCWIVVSWIFSFASPPTLYALKWPCVAQSCSTQQCFCVLFSFSRSVGINWSNKALCVHYCFLAITAFFLHRISLLRAGILMWQLNTFLFRIFCVFNHFLCSNLSLRATVASFYLNPDSRTNVKLIIIGYLQSMSTRYLSITVR